MPTRRSSFLLVLSLALPATVLAQVGGPQYPPGTGYPQPPGRTGGRTGAPPPAPRGRVKDKSKTGTRKVDENKVLVQSIRGMLRRMDDKRIIVQADDKRFIQIVREDETRLLKVGGGEAVSADFVPGDAVLVEGYPGEDELIHALRVTWESKGSEADRTAAAGPLPPSVRFEDDRPAEEIAKETPREGPPKLTRGGPAGAAPKTPEKAEEPKPQPQQPVAAPVEEARERSTIVVDKTPDPEPAFKVKRGRPAPRPRDPDDDIPATAAPSVSTPTTTEEAPKPAPIATEGAAAAKSDPLIDKAREIAMEYSETLPNYLAKQMTTRFAGNGKKDRWQALDNFTADVVYQDGKESYRNVLLNGKPAKGKIEQTGAWSRGEFGTTLRDVLSPASNANFKPRGNTYLNTRKAKFYDFTVEQENSHWMIGVPGQTFYPAYRGSIWIDVETSRVLRIEMQGHKIPSAFPVDVVESAVEWDFVKIGNSSYLVPTHAETLSCMRAEGMCSKNVMDFRNYRKFGAQSELIVEPPQ